MFVGYAMCCCNEVWNLSPRWLTLVCNASVLWLRWSRLGALSHVQIWYLKYKLSDTEEARADHCELSGLSVRTQAQSKILSYLTPFTLLPVLHTRCTFFPCQHILCFADSIYDASGERSDIRSCFSTQSVSDRWQMNSPVTHWFKMKASVPANAE